MSTEEVPTSPGGSGGKPPRLTMKTNADAISDLAQVVQQNSNAVGSQVVDIMSALKGIQRALDMNAQVKATEDIERARLEAAAKAAQDTARVAQQAADEAARALSAVTGVPPPAPPPTHKTPPHHVLPNPEVAPRYQHPNHPSRTIQPIQQQLPTVAGAGAEDPTAVAAKIARAIQAACFAPEQGMSHPHHYITRGPEGERIGLAKASWAEFIHGFRKMIKAEEKEDPEVAAAMQNHLDKFVEDCTEFKFEIVRNFSEKVCTIIADRTETMTWFSLPEINDLRSRMVYKYQAMNDPIDYTHAHSPQRAQSSRQTRPKQPKRVENPHNLPTHVLNALPGPPCPLYQTDACSEPGHHVLGGHRSLHICADCNSYEQVFKTHPASRCRSRGRYPQVGFGGPPNHPPPHQRFK